MALTDKEAEQVDYYLGVPSVTQVGKPVMEPVGPAAEPLVAFRGTLADLRRWKTGQKKKHWWDFLDDLWASVGGHGVVSVLVGDMRRSWDSIPRPLALARPADTFHHVLLPFNWGRHFRLEEDPVAWKAKRGSAVFRGATTGRLWAPGGRGVLVRRWVGDARVNVGFSKIANSRVQRRLVKGPLTRVDMMGYRVIISVEGNDVASGLKWQMASGSVVAMCKPRVTSWFREEALREWVHYVPLLDDYSDLVEKLVWVDANPDQARAIVLNANAYVRPFRDWERQRALAREVLLDYLPLVTGS